MFRARVLNVAISIGCFECTSYTYSFTTHLKNAMKKRIIRVAVLYFLLFVPMVTMAQDPNFYIYICFGQSNMDGSADIQTQDKTVDSRFQVFQTVDCSNLSRTHGNWYTANPPLSRCWNGLSPADYFGRTMVENLPEGIKVGVINVSVSGCRIELFDKDLYEGYLNTFSDQWFQDIVNAYDRNPYGHLVKMAKLAQKDGVIKGFLLHQGESNNGDSNWPKRVKKIYDDLITDLSLNAEEIPLLAGELVNADQGGALAGMNTIINKLPETLENSYVISSSGCTSKDDNIHFNSAGVRELGKRYGDKMLEILGVVEPVPVPLGWVAPASFEFDPIYPNPSSDEVLFTFSVATSSEVEISLFDLAGNEIQQLINGHFQSGNHQVKSFLESIKPGIYLVKLKAGSNTQTQRLIVR